MIIKKENSLASHLSPFDLFSKKETALTKALAYVLAREPEAFATFLRLLGLNNIPRRVNDLFKDTSIEVEIPHKNIGRTDIEIYKKGAFHVIIECKIGENEIKTQRQRYLDCFKCDAKQQIMCFITQDRDSNRQKQNGIIVRNFSWLDILTEFERCQLDKFKTLQQFMAYVQRRYEMGRGKEVLVQDISDPTEINRYFENKVYRRPLVRGTPLYFAPYFTQRAPKEYKRGLRYISPILGVLTLGSNENISEYSADLESFATDKDGLVSAWIDGVIDRKGQEQTLTYFFLDEPAELPISLMKNDDEGWISRNITRNRRLSFPQIFDQLKKNWSR